MTAEVKPWTPATKPEGMTIVAEGSTKPSRTFVMKQPRKDELRRQLEVAKGMAAVHAEEARRLRRIASYAIGGCLLLFVADVIRWLA